MKATELLEDLRGRGVDLKSEAGSLVVDAPAGVLTEDLRVTLSEQKPRIIAALRWEQVVEEADKGKGRTVRAGDGRRFDARPSRHPGYTSLYDPVEGEWHDFPTRDCYPSVVDLARRRREKGAKA